jgi:hypothetical protein
MYLLQEDDMTAWFNALMQGRLIRRGAPLAILVLIVGALAAGTAIGNTATCTNTAATLAGSGFEIDVDANQVVNNTGCIDWLDTSTASGTQQDAIIKQDTQSGSGDESFGNGTKEDTALPSVVDGGIPPNKSDLKAFGVFTESSGGTSGFLELLWTRVQEPSGTTNMDFELNQKFCDLSATPTNCAPNGITPLRTVGDKLITYDLDRGGTRATISIRTWNGTAWGDPTVLTSQVPPQALGTINTTQITAANSLSSLGALTPRTFGEASISFEALFGSGACGQFGSAYLKSRSSDSFTAALKDFVPPQRVDISNCPTGLTTQATASVILGEPISDTATLSGGVSPTGTITFHLFPSLADCEAGTNEIDTGLTPVTVNGNGDYNSGNFTPTATGTYFWVANYSGDGTNDPSATACDDANEQSVVNKAASTLETAQSFYPNDTATVSATAGGNPTGDVTFTLFQSADCSGTVLLGPVTVPLSGGQASTNNTTVAVSTSTTVSWQVAYSGDTSHDPVSSCVENTQLTITNGGPVSSS